jgi:RHS repeat-associated protein
MIRQNNTATFIDRLGSDRNGSRYYPYGEEYTATGNDRNKFATYFRDSSTGLDYAINRYYGSTMGRFLTPDRYGPSARLGSPQSWNRYAYVTNDPVNTNDPSGLDPIQGNIFFDYPAGGGTDTWVDDWLWAEWIRNSYPADRGAGGGASPEAAAESSGQAAIAKARNQARLLLSVKECGDFIKQILTKIGNQPDLDSFLHNFDQLTIIQAPASDRTDAGRPSFRHAVHVAGGVGQTATLHVVLPNALDLAPALLHDTFHTLYYGISDFGVAAAIGNPVSGELITRNKNLAARVASNRATDAFNLHCDPAKLGQ